MPVSGFVRFKHRSAGYRAILRSDTVRADLQTRADRVKTAAETQLAGDGVTIIADTTVGRGRAGGTVIGVPMRIEARKRVLGRAIDAAR